MRNVLISSFVIGFVVVLLAWIAIVVYALKIVRNVRDGVSLWSGRLGYNPVNVVFHPELLTPEGLKHRQRLGWAVAIFAGLLLGTLLLGVLVGNLPT